MDTVLKGSERPVVLERAKQLMREDSISKADWCRITGYSEGQFYRWLRANTNTTHVATTEQAITCCESLGWSPTYLYFGIGPPRLSDFNNGELATGVDLAAENNRMLKKLLALQKQNK
jgi:hypothetical protein